MKLTPEQMRVVIAERCGWKKVYLTTKDSGDAYSGKFGGNVWLRPGLIWDDLDYQLQCDYFNKEAKPLNYPFSLDAMHEAEKAIKILANGYWDTYCRILKLICRPLNCGIENAMCGYTIHATALQRAEAFCRITKLEQFE